MTPVGRLLLNAALVVRALPVAAFPLAALHVAALSVATSDARAAESAPAPELTREQAKELRSLLGAFLKATDPAERDAAVEGILGLGPAAAGHLAGPLAAAWERERSAYADALGRAAREAYLKGLAALTEDDIRQVQIDRFFFTIYFENGMKQNAEPTSPMVRGEARKPDWKGVCEPAFRRLREMLVLDPEEIAGTEALAPLRERLVALGEKRARCLELAQPGGPPLPKSPTGLEFPPPDVRPDQPEILRRFERAVVLARTIAGPENDEALLENERRAEHLDVEEARAFMYTNERRLLAGSTTMGINVLLTIAARDHSIDRAHKEASGHFHPTKGGFVERSLRWGAPRPSAEGAGGGRDGPNAVDGLCYGGGHTGGVYGPWNIESGIGRHEGAFTFIYSRGKRHTPMWEDGFFMPPGIAAKSLSGTAARAYAAVRADAVRSVQPLFARRDAWSGKADADSVALRFMASYVELRIDHEIALLGSLEAAGDWYRLALRLNEGRARLGGVEKYAAWTAPMDAAVRKPRRREVLTGQEYYLIETTAEQAIKRKPGDAAALRKQLALRLEEFAKKAEGTAYAEAAREAAAALGDKEVTFADAFGRRFRQAGELDTIPRFPDAPPPEPPAPGPEAGP